MDTKLDAFQQQHIDPAKAQCPRCGADTPKQNISYRNPQTGEVVDKPESQTWIVIYTLLEAFLMALAVAFKAFIAAGIVALLVVGTIFSLAHNPYENPLVNTAVALGLLFPFVGAFVAACAAFIAISRHQMRKRNRLSKTYITIHHFVCWQCKNEWTVTQEPTAKKLS
jgi:hypothetical protein